jgi:hypothetical protein
VDIVSLLLKAGASLADNHSTIINCLFCSFNHLKVFEMVEILLDNGVKIDSMKEV